MLVPNLDDVPSKIRICPARPCGSILKISASAHCFGP